METQTVLALVEMVINLAKLSALKHSEELKQLIEQREVIRKELVKESTKDTVNVTA